MFKILHTIPDLHLGGVAKLLLKLLDTWRDERFEHHLCYFGNNEQLLPDFQKRPVKIHKIEHKGLPGILKTSRAFSKLVDIHRFDLIHSNLFLDRLIVGVSSFHDKIPFIVSLHTTNSLSDQKSLKNKILVNVEDLVGRFTIDGFIAVSATVKKAAVKHRYVKKSKVVVIPSGVALPAVAQKEILKNQTIKLIAVGRLIESKNFDMLLQALKFLIEKKHNVNLVIVGEGPQRKYLETLAIELQLKEQVNFIGYSARVSDFLHESDIFVSCSTEEGFGLSVVEAMAHSLPVVAFDIPIFKEISGEGNSLSLVKKGAIKDLAEKIDELIHDKQKYSMLSSKSFERVQNEYRIEVCGQNYLEYYSRRIKENR